MRVGKVVAKCSRPWSPSLRGRAAQPRHPRLKSTANPAPHLHLSQRCEGGPGPLTGRLCTCAAEEAETGGTPSVETTSSTASGHWGGLFEGEDKCLGPQGSPRAPALSWWVSVRLDGSSTPAVPCVSPRAPESHAAGTPSVCCEPGGEDWGSVTSGKGAEVGLGRSQPAGI